MKHFFRWLLGKLSDFLTPGQRATHTYVIGQPGTGKSRAIESWVRQDISSGQGGGLIDPHGDLFERLLFYIATIPEVWKRVVILDPCNPKWTVSFNPLGAIHGFSQERLSLFLTDVMMKIWRLEATTSPRMIWLLTNTFLALSNLGLTLLDLPRFLLDNAFRASLLPRLAHEGARAYFLYEFPKSPGAIHQWVTPVLNKIGGLIFDPDVRLMLAGGSTLNFRAVLDSRLILLVNLPKGIIGEGASALLGAFIVAHLQKAALSRANSRWRNPFYLYLDEFQNYTTDNIKDILSESRKYSLSLILAHQYLDQLSPDLRSAALNTAGTIVSFRVGYQDAYHLAKEVFPSPDFLDNSERGIRLRRVGRWPRLRLVNHRESLGWSGLAQTLAKLPNREFWARRRGTFLPTKQRTFEVLDPVITQELRVMRRELLDFSGQRYGKLKKDVQQGLESKHPRIYAEFERGMPVNGLTSAEDGIPFWSE